MINWKMIYKIMGFLLFIEAGFLSLCIIFSAFYEEPDLQAFITSTLITIGFGIPLSYAGKNAERRLSRKDGYIVVTLAWILFFASIRRDTDPLQALRGRGWIL